jgi:hypothetical protein
LPPLDLGDLVKLTRDWFCDHIKLEDWRKALQIQNCDKGLMMSFPYWICESYLAREWEDGEEKVCQLVWKCPTIFV